MGVTRGVRVAYAVVAWAFLAGLVVQVFLISLYIFDRSDGSAVSAHAGLGWLLHLVPLLILPLAYFARAGRSQWLWALALAVLVFIVPILATLRGSSPAVAALHPVGAMASFVLAAIVAWNSWRALREQPESAEVPT